MRQNQQMNQGALPPGAPTGPTTTEKRETKGRFHQARLNRP